jgi:simple sugar transport system permease protein
MTAAPAPAGRASAPNAAEQAPARTTGALLAIASPLLAIALALAAGALFILAIGERPLEIYALMARESFGTGYGIGQTLFRATPLVFTGLAVALGFRAGLFNIGVEGQLYLGGLAAAVAGAALGAWPAVLLLPAAIAAAALAGALWAAIPGVLKARTGAHEVINSIMLNFIAFALVAYLGRSLYQPATVRTAEIAAGAVIPRLGAWWPALKAAPANASILLAALAAALVAVLLFRTRWGYEIRAVGMNAPAAAYGGIAIGGTQVRAMTLSGALAGLGGVNFVLGYKHYFEQGFSAGAGFLGIAVSLIGRNHPVGVIAAALFFGALSYAGLVINQRVPKELVEILQGVVILCAIGSQQVLERIARRAAARSGARR